MSKSAENHEQCLGKRTVVDASRGPAHEDDVSGVQKEGQRRSLLSGPTACNKDGVKAKRDRDQRALCVCFGMISATWVSTCGPMEAEHDVCLHVGRQGIFLGVIVDDAARQLD